MKNKIIEINRIRERADALKSNEKKQKPVYSVVEGRDIGMLCITLVLFFELSYWAIIR